MASVLQGQLVYVKRTMVSPLRTISMPSAATEASSPMPVRVEEPPAWPKAPRTFRVKFRRAALRRITEDHGVASGIGVFTGLSLGLEETACELLDLLLRVGRGSALADHGGHVFGRRRGHRSVGRGGCSPRRALGFDDGDANGSHVFLREEAAWGTKAGVAPVSEIGGGDSRLGGCVFYLADHFVADIPEAPDGNHSQAEDDFDDESTLIGVCLWPPERAVRRWTAAACSGGGR